MHSCDSEFTPIHSLSAALITSLLLLLQLGCATTDRQEAVPANRFDSSTYYLPQNFGSNALYTPASAFVSYALDTLQLPENFDTENFNADLSQVWDRLKHPRRAIDEEGGFRRFVNREIFPIDSDFRKDSFAALPNYTLHLLGGGIAYRRDVEWLVSRGYRYPRLAATALAMVGEIIQEGLEVQNTTDADPVADVYLFRPIGLLLFSSDRIAGNIQRYLDPAIWSPITAWDLTSQKFTNTGISYIYRPPSLTIKNARLFLHSGLNNLVGFSHRLSSGNHLSWGVGAAVQEVVRQRNIQVDLRPSVGLFLDRQKSLLGSIVINDVGSTRLRVNLYPGFRATPKNTGLFLTVSDDQELSAGLIYRLPLGVAVGSH